jgi:hypothetical protein
MKDKRAAFLLITDLLPRKYRKWAVFRYTIMQFRSFIHASSSDVEIKVATICKTKAKPKSEIFN